MVLQIFSSLGTTLWGLNRGKLGLSVKMANSLGCLRGLVTGEIANICNSLSLEPSDDFDPLGTLQKIDQVVVAINFLDSVVRLPEEVYLDISVARHIL